MLAPLKNRSLIEQAKPDSLEQSVGQLLSENSSLKSALRQSRQSQKRHATLSANRITAQTDEINRLGKLLSQTTERLTQLESGQVIIELGQKLMQLNEINNQLANAAQRVWYLDKTICAAHAECERLSRERDALASQVGQTMHKGARHMVAGRTTNYLASRP